MYLNSHSLTGTKYYYCDTKTWCISQNERKPKKHKFDKNMALFDLLTPVFLQIINEIHGGLVHWKKFNIHGETHQRHNPLTTLQLKY